jgi:CRISPR-associated protein Csb2
VPVRFDKIAGYYTKSGKIWHSFTPVILPGHDDYDPKKRLTLIEKALRQAGIDQSCEFEASPSSWFRKSYSAHKYGKDKRPQGYIRPGYLLSQTAVHLTLRFQENVSGPIAIGAGRHCGLGLFAPAD